MIFKPVSEEGGAQVTRVQTELATAIKVLGKLDIDSPKTHDAELAVLKAAREYHACLQSFSKGRNLEWLLFEKFDSDEAKIIVAHHEAGHFVVSHLCGLEMDDISIQKQGMHEGYVEHRKLGNLYYRLDSRDFAKAKEVAESLITIAYAGYYAERRINPRVILFGCQRDFDNAVSIVETNYPEDTPEQRLQRLDRLAMNASNLIRKWWNVVEKLANELIQNELGSARAAHRLVELELSRSQVSETIND